ncbi:hypothetical protein K9N68_29290 [Kovacikia minuta CCNUW1]|uniref:hypothetical protein n=1 Tax=Kovacikia minuta TaxID=2931930 RepID=UPI001CCDC661|nr:hypothetical protein [Kovacikia minuta]UBF25618.1 hypothetical protein K9N68_29290 [Kovacikia minuta CCNUW1]
MKRWLKEWFGDRRGWQRLRGRRIYFVGLLLLTMVFCGVGVPALAKSVVNSSVEWVSDSVTHADAGFHASTQPCM